MAARHSDANGRWARSAQILGFPALRYPSLTLGNLGVSIVWSLEMSSASSYLVSLGVSRAGVAAVLFAGPLSGLLVQPVIGLLTDNSTSRFGRRRPALVVGVVMTAASTLLLGYTRHVASVFTPPHSPANDTLTIALAVLAIYMIDCSINVAQALDRVLIVDTLPTAQQPAGNAWVARMSIVGGLIGFCVGNFQLPSLLPFLGSTQLEVLSAIACFCVLVTHLWMVAHVREPVLLTPGTHKTLRQELALLWYTLKRLPRSIRQIFLITFFASIAYFPIFSYTPLYFGDLYARTLPPDDPARIGADTGAEASRLASRAFLYSSLISLAGNFVLPAIVSRRKKDGSGTVFCTGKAVQYWRPHLATLWTIGHALFAACLVSTAFLTTVSGATVMIAVSGICGAIGHWVPPTLLGEAILSHTISSNTTVNIELGRTTVGSGRATAVTDEDEELQPLANGSDLHGDEWLGTDKYADDEVSINSIETKDEVGNHGHHIVLDAQREAVGQEDFGPEGLKGSGPVRSAQVQVGSEEDLSWEGTCSGFSAQAGSILGINNVFIVVPQMMVTALASFIFALFDNSAPGGVAGSSSSADPDVAADVGRPGSGAMAVIFQLASVAAMVAAVLTYRLSRELIRDGA